MRYLDLGSSNSRPWIQQFPNKLSQIILQYKYQFQYLLFNEVSEDRKLYLPLLPLIPGFVLYLSPPHFFYFFLLVFSFLFFSFFYVFFYIFQYLFYFLNHSLQLPPLAAASFSFSLCLSLCSFSLATFFCSNLRTFSRLSRAAINSCEVYTDRGTCQNVTFENVINLDNTIQYTVKMVKKTADKKIMASKIMKKN